MNPASVEIFLFELLSQYVPDVVEGFIELIQNNEGVNITKMGGLLPLE